MKQNACFVYTKCNVNDETNNNNSSVNEKLWLWMSCSILELCALRTYVEFGFFHSIPLCTDAHIIIILIFKTK